ncbi:MAG TPA: histidine kinase [Gammaproteobacteria bacterium]|nr:histidine kinase [Gammaproteobacteria bacterium]
MNTCPAFLLGHTRSADRDPAVTDCLRQIGDVPAEANLGFLYVTDSFANELQLILDRFRAETGIEHWIGTVGIGICASGTEYAQVSAMAAMIGCFPEHSYRVLPFYNRAADHLPGAWDDWLQQSESHVAVVHGDPGNNNLPMLLGQLHGELPGGYLLGGLSSSHGAHPQIADELLEGGLSGVVFNDQVSIATGLSQGCSPIAGKHAITDCANNVINRIDDRPALDVFREDIGEILARDLNRAAGYIFAGLPIKGSDTGDYLVRNLVGIDTRGKRLAIGDLVHPGQALHFCRRDSNTAREDMQRMLDDLKRRVPGTPRGGLYFSCLGRGQDLFGEPSAELKMIEATLGEFPLVGFFANGEIFNDQLYGYTGVLTVFN